MDKIIGIIGAMDEEINLLLRGMENKSLEMKCGIQFYRGTFADRSVVVCKSGVGKVNAAVTTQVLIDTFKASQVLFTGVAGALHPELNIGDIVISSECMQHDMDVTPLGFARGIIPFQEVSSFPADPELIGLAQKACCELQVQYMTGKVLSGDQFIASLETVTRLREEFGGVCAEMEGAAVAQTCYMNSTPFIIIRSMSDKADGSAHVNFTEFTVEASRRSHAILEYMLPSL
ncbi:5'-methylthioadenosine/adenosylhomocysteine nucleosidase [Paenibacillus wynnii]|uniref:5'-methylthioadenosine/adenosylhomocysteine nucleosidase n=1 Tax=Paenibacillus wynnii TaxID=268407 RepID=UPI00278D848F|nr:5'-methylthioadenosine/adenosylhomocysteine nucleosidase [Paenibacillus wynnii]MDQ0193126.1 adenosylhomocysteine nucleosidase [Paenibacillus wynnii]